MLPIIALIGRPNVGKSTLFNCLTKTRDALVADVPGLTRDRQYGEGCFNDQRFIVIDTGGMDSVSRHDAGQTAIDKAMVQQSLRAIDEADVILFVLDAKSGPTVVDEWIVGRIRRMEKPVFYVANKIDGVNPDTAIADCYRLGMQHVYPVTATHGKGVSALLSEVFASLPTVHVAAEPDSEKHGIKIAIIGRPNVGKSTLLNRLLGEERVIVCDHPGTTRDSIYAHYERNGQAYTLIDTAGIRRRKNVKAVVEKFSIIKTLKAIDDAHVVVMILDAREGIVDQDLHLLGHVIASGRGLVIAINKWDGLDDHHKQRIKGELKRRVQFIHFAHVHYISAMHGTGVSSLYQSVNGAYQAATQKLPTGQLNAILERAIAEHPPPMVRGRRIKLRYAHAGGMNPPTIVIHGNQTDQVPNSYHRYLQKVFARECKLAGTPIKIVLKSGKNPYAGKKNTLTQRQMNKRRRMMAFLKKKKK